MELQLKLKRKNKIYVKNNIAILLIIIIFTITSITFIYPQEKIIKLPKPKYKSEISIEEAILKRRSIRTYKDIPLSIYELSQLLWSAQGITEKRLGLRTAPSAGATYPLEIYIVVGKVTNLESGIYRYNPEKHEIILLYRGDKRIELSNAALGQSSVKFAPITIVITAIYERTTKIYGERGIRYVHMEAGHVAQNIYLQCVSLNLGTVSIGAFKDEEVRKILNLPKNEHPLYLMPVGKI